MPSIIDSLVLELGLDPSGFTKGQKDAEDAFLKTKDHAVSTGKTIEASSKKAADSLQLIARQALALFAVLLGGRGIKEFITDITKLDAAAGRMGANIKLDPKYIRAFGRAAAEMGGDANVAVASLQKVSDMFQEIQVGGDVPTKLALLFSKGGQKLNIRDTPDEFMNKAAIALQNYAKINRPQAVNWAKSLGFDEGTIEGMIKFGAAYRQHIKDLEKGPSKVDIEAAEARQKAWSDMMATGEHVAEVLTTHLSTAILWAEEKLTHLGEWFEIG